MNDYISREALKERLEHRYILSDLEHPHPRLYRQTDIMDIIDTIPSADVVEVIRCKDCKHFNLDKWGKVNDIPLIVAHEICDFWGEGCKTDKDAYCSFAERGIK